MENKTPIIILIAVGLILIGLTLSKNDQKTQEPVQQLAPTVTATEERYKEEFMGSCVSEGLYSYCNCTYDYMFKKEGLAGIMNMSLEYDRTKKLTPLMTEAVSNCGYLVK